MTDRVACALHLGVISIRDVRSSRRYSIGAGVGVALSIGAGVGVVRSIGAGQGRQVIGVFEGAFECRVAAVVE